MGHFLQLLARPFRALADKGLRARLADLEQQLAERDGVIRVRDLELAELAALVARNHKRVAAETADFARQIADAENLEQEGRRHGQQSVASLF